MTIVPFLDLMRIIIDDNCPFFWIWWKFFLMKIVPFSRFGENYHSWQLSLFVDLMRIIIYDNCMWYVICDIWYVIYECDIWYVIYDMWYMNVIYKIWSWAKMWRGQNKGILTPFEVSPPSVNHLVRVGGVINHQNFFGTFVLFLVTLHYSGGPNLIFWFITHPQLSWVFVADIKTKVLLQ